MTLYEIRYSPESYYVGVRVTDRDLAYAVLDELQKRARWRTSDLSVTEVEVFEGTVEALADEAILAWTETMEYDGNDMFRTPDDDEEEPSSRLPPSPEDAR